MSSSIRPFTLPSSDFFAASHVRSLSFTLPFFCTMTPLLMPASSTHTAANTSSTPLGGVAIVLQLPRSFLSSVSSDFIAASIAGSASARSAIASSFFFCTSFWSAATLAASTFAFSVSPATTSRSALTRVAIASETSRFSSALSIMILRSCSSDETASAAERSLSMPFCSRAVATLFSSFFSPSSLTYSLSSSRYVFGVVETYRPSSAKKRVASCETVTNDMGMNFSMPSLSSVFSPKSRLARNFLPTVVSASSGHGWNQSITVALTSAGNLVARVRKSTPTGEKHRQTCRFARTCEMKYLKHDWLSCGTPAALAFDATAFASPSCSSLEYRSGMYALASRSLRYTRKRSFVIWLSVKRKSTPSCLTPALLYMFCRSPLKSAMP